MSHITTKLHNYEQALLQVGSHPPLNDFRSLRLSRVAKNLVKNEVLMGSTWLYDDFRPWVSLLQLGRDEFDAIDEYLASATPDKNGGGHAWKLAEPGIVSENGLVPVVQWRRAYNQTSASLMALQTRRPPYSPR